MITVVNYDALEKAQKELNNTLDSNILYKFQDSLSNLYDYLETNDNLHDCFSPEIANLMTIQEDAVTPTENYLKLATIIPIIIKTFKDAENNSIQNIREFINNFFSNSSLGLLPFTYREIQEVNEKYNRKVDLRIQGYTVAGDYYLVTAYDHNKKINSRVYIYDKAGRCVGYIELQNKNDKDSHVGGITYDEKNDILFITGKSGEVNTYNLKDITDSLKQSEKVINRIPSLEGNVDLSAINRGTVNIKGFFEENTSAATTYYSESDKALYIADCAGKGTLIKYSVSVSGKKVQFNDGKIVSKDFASCCQGVATYKDPQGKKYIYASQSYGAYHDSVIKKYEVTNTGIKEVGATTINTPGLEGIQIDSQGNLSGVFENFKNTDNPNQTLNINVNTIDFSKPLSESRIDLEKFYEDMGRANQEKLNS